MGKTGERGVQISESGIARFRPNPWLFLPLISATSLLLVFFLDFFSPNKLILLLFAALPLIYFVLLNTHFAIMTMVGAMWLNHYVANFHVATMSTLVLLASFLLTYRRANRSIWRNPLVLPFFFYLICMFPSLINTTNPFKCLMFSFNLLAVALVFTVVGKFYDNWREIKHCIFVFLAFAVVNGIIVIRLGSQSGDREFGFTGIVYVDFACVAIIITIMMFFLLKGGRRLFAVITMLLLISALIFTQTRNTLVSLMLAMFTMFGILFVYSQKFNIRRTRVLINFIVAAGLLTILGLLVFRTMPSLFERHADFFASDRITLNEMGSFAQSSLLTRLLIWHTAVYAFLEHPFIGIGAYAFSFDAPLYAEIPTSLVKMFVQDLSPHVTYLAVVTETGLLGLSGFLVFWGAALFMSFKAFKMSETREEAVRSFGILFVHIYIYFSMTMSDAWLWGQCGILWGLVLGISLANYNIIKLKNQSLRQS